MVAGMGRLGRTARYDHGRCYGVANWRPADNYWAEGYLACFAGITVA